MKINVMRIKSDINSIVNYFKESETAPSGKKINTEKVG